MSFEAVYKYTKQFEAGYANSKLDNGGETFRGISRVANPQWPGWAIVDHYKAQIEKREGPIDWHKQANWGKIDHETSNDIGLKAMVTSMYKYNYWQPVERLGFSDQLASKLFDIHVNAGWLNMARILQRAVNDLSPDMLEIDGKIGQKTKDAVARENHQLLLHAIVEQQKAHYERTALKQFPNARPRFMERAEWIPQ